MLLLAEGNAVAILVSIHKVGFVETFKTSTKVHPHLGHDKVERRNLAEVVYCRCQCEQ